MPIVWFLCEVVDSGEQRADLNPCYSLEGEKGNVISIITCVQCLMRTITIKPCGIENIHYPPPPPVEEKSKTSENLSTNFNKVV